MKKGILYSIRLIAVIILFQTLYFKFTAHTESVELFSKLGVEPWGRITVGIIELIAGVLLLINATAIIGAALGIMLMIGATASHLFTIGINTNNDGGLLFIMALIVLICCSIYLNENKKGVIQMLQKLSANKSKPA